MPESSGGPLVAGLPMYDWPEVRWATDAMWGCVAAHLREAGIPAPSALDRGRPAEALWRDPGLVFGQTCGYPYVRSLRGQVRLIATPCYRADGCKGPTYSSAILVRSDNPADDLRALAGRPAAVNDRMSLSGHVALDEAGWRACGVRNPFSALMSGSHRESMRMVAGGVADLCAVDAVCWALAQRHERALTAGLRVLAWTPMLPALPFICATAIRWPTGMLRTALLAALSEPRTATAKWREALLLDGAVVLGDDAYEPIAALEGIEGR